ncbi:uncharacterized protein LOC584262 isoform X1 [Strongylocentrotus purpuratus]|uniref:Uncharacterized protein n=1 Tax=Strongylocentrotus purpuratus TaxID=7668 RepID=A0A7M7SYS1_STRPU|nr:uncharacterized protein LOC584262 isoform X1 [Strongylocentrotus purpuratus]
MGDEAAGEAEETTVLPLSLAEITAFRNGEHLHNAVSERELWAICKECCSALQSIVESRSVDDLRLCPQSLILNPDGNITVINSEGHVGAEFQAPEVTTLGVSEKSLTYSLGKTLLSVKNDWPVDSALHDLLHNLISTDTCNRLTLTEVAQLSQLSLQKLSGHYKEGDEQNGWSIVPNIQDANSNCSRETSKEKPINQSTKDNISDSSDLQSNSSLSRHSKPSQRVSSLIKPVLQAALRDVPLPDKMAAGGHLGPPSLETFGNLSPRAQEILRKIYSSENSYKPETTGTPKGGSDSNLSTLNNEAKYFTADSKGRLGISNPLSKRNSIGSTTDSFLHPQRVSPKDQNLSRRYSVGETSSKTLCMNNGGASPSPNASPVPIITVSRPSSETPPPIMAENRHRVDSMQSAVTTQVSNAFTKFINSRKISGGNKPQEKSIDVQDTQRVQESHRRESVDNSSSYGGTDDEHSSGHQTDADLYMLDDPFTETESEGESAYSNRVRSNSIATCNTFNSKSSAFRVTQSKIIRKQSLSNLTEIQEEESKASSADMSHTVENASSAYSNIKDLAMLRNKRASNIHAPKSSDLLSSTTHFTPIVLSATNSEGSIGSPVMDKAKVKAKKAMELIKLDLKAPRRDKPPPTMLQDLENDATDFVPVDQGNNVQHVNKMAEQTQMGDKRIEKQNSESSEDQSKPELTTDQKLKILFEKHGLGSPNPSPRSSPNPGIASIPSGTTPHQEMNEKNSSNAAVTPVHNSAKVIEDTTDKHEIKLENNPIADLTVKRKISGSENCSSPIIKIEPVTLVQNSPLNMEMGFAPISKPNDKTDDLLGSLSEDPSPASKSLLKTKDKSTLENVVPQKTSTMCDGVRTFPKHGIVDERRGVEEAKHTTTHPVIDMEAVKSNTATAERTTDFKMGEKDSASTMKISKVQMEIISNESSVQEKPNIQLVQTGSVLSASSASYLTAVTLHASKDQDIPNQLAMKNIPIQVHLQQDPETGLYRVLPMGSPLQGLPVHITSTSSTPTSPVQLVTNSNAAMVSPVQTHTYSPNSLVSPSVDINKSIPRKKKFVETSSDPDSSSLSYRHHHRHLADRKKEHTKKRTERTKYTVSPHKKSLNKLPMSNLITDSESSESSFSSPALSLGHEKGQIHVRPHRRKPTKSPASSHGDSDHRKERHRDQLNASRSPQIEKLYQEHTHRPQSKSKEKGSHTPPTPRTTPTGDHKSHHIKSSHLNRTHSAQALRSKDDTDDTKPVDHTLMPRSPLSVSMSSPSRDSGVHLRYTTSSGEDLPMIQEAHLVDALQSNSHLKKVIKQIRQAFAFDGYLENGVEDLHMAEYISSLASVTFTTFSGAVTEKFCDLYWEEELLEGLYEAVNGKEPTKLTNKSVPMSQKSSEVRRQSKETISQVKDMKAGRENSRGRNEGKQISSDAARKMDPKSQENKTKHGEGEDKSKEKVAQRRSTASKDAKSHRAGVRIEGSREKKTSSAEQPRPSSSKKLIGERDKEKVSQRKQSSVEAPGERLDKCTDDAKADSRRISRQRQARDKTYDGEQKETRISQKDETEGRKQENIGGHIHKVSENERESKIIRSEEAAAGRTCKVSVDSKDGRASRNSRDGRERRGGKGSQERREDRTQSRNSGSADKERREDRTQSRKSGSTDNLVHVEEEDMHKPSSLKKTNTNVNQQTRKSEERNDENGNMKSQESLLSSSKDSSYVDHSSRDSLIDQFNDSLYLSSTSDLSSSLPLPNQQSTPVLNRTLPMTKSEVIQARLPPAERNSPHSTHRLLSASRRDSMVSFSSTSSGTSSRTHQSFATSSLFDSTIDGSIEESRLVIPSGVLFSGDKVDPSVAEYARNLTGCGETQNSIESKISEVDQQLTLEKRSQKKTAKFYRKLQEKVSSENKGIASKVKQELAETNQKIEFLESAKRHLEILYAEQWGLDFSLLYSFAIISGDEKLVRQAENPLLTMHTMRTITTLQAGEPKGLFSYLYARQALLDGYLPHFFYTYHYFATSQQLLDFITSRFMLACKQKLLNGEDDVTMSIIARTIDILHVWVEGFFDVDFKPYPQFLQELLTFVSDQMVPVEYQSRFLLHLLERRQQDAVNGLTSVAARVQNSNDSLPTISKPMQPLPWQVPNSSQSEKTSGFKASLMGCFIRKPSKQQESSAYTQAPHAPREGFHMSDYTSQTIAHILTLNQQALFIEVHPIHFLNSRCYSISVKDTAKSPYSIQLQPSPSSRNEGEGSETKSLFTQKVFEGKEIRDLLDLGQVVSHWVSAEVVTSSSAKTQVALLSKFVSTAKTCLELRNFASCVQILDGLDNVLVRQVPAWRDLPSKVVGIYEDLNACRVLLQGDSEYLMKGDKTSPTLPATLLFLLHVQQLEIGGFQLTNGMFKWTKLRSIAKLVDGIRIFQETSYSFDVDSSLPGQLKQRIEEFSSQDIHVLAARHSSNYHQLSSDKGRKFTSTFQKMRAGLH